MHGETVKQKILYKLVFCYGNNFRSFFRPSTGQRFCGLIIWKQDYVLASVSPTPAKNEREVNIGLDCYYDRKLPAILIHNINTAVIVRGAPKGGRGLRPTSNWNFKTDFIDRIILNILRDLPFIQNQPLKLIDN